MFIYVALLTEELTEPSPNSGYARALVGEFTEPPQIENVNVVFDESIKSDLGLITRVGLFDSETDGELVSVLDLADPVSVPTGVIPILRNGKLLMGVDVTAKVLAGSSNACNW